MRYYIKRHSHKIARAFLAAVVLVGIALGTKYFIANRGEVGMIDEKLSPTTESDSSPSTISSRVLAMGNVSWGGHLQDVSQANSLKAAYPFSGLNTLMRGQYDAWVGNLNCSLVDTLPAPSNDTSCPASYLAEAGKWFDVFALGNSHTNKGSTIAATRKSLTTVGIQYVGDEDVDSLNNLCSVVALPARFKLGDGSYKVAQLPLAMCSINVSAGAPENKQYDTVARYAKQLPVWVYAYTGDDTETIGQTELQKSIYRSFIDVGADLVVGNHPYSVQGAESYKRKLIVYSLGNLMYSGASSDVERQRSVSLNATMSSKVDPNMQGWANFVKDCVTAQETCLATATEKALTKPVYGYEFALITSDSVKDGIVKKSDGMWEEQASKRLTWDTILPTLSYTQSK